MENQKNPSLDALLGEEQAPLSDEQTTEQLFEHVLTTLVGLDASLANMNVGLRAVNSRIETLENFVAYLLSKDPEAGPRLKGMAEKAEAAAKAQNDTVLPQVPTEVK